MYKTFWQLSLWSSYILLFGLQLCMCFNVRGRLNIQLIAVDRSSLYTYTQTYVQK